MAVQSDVMEAAGPYDRAKALSAFKLGDVTFYWITRVCAISVLLILGGIILSLIAGAWPAMKEYGFAFLWTQRWAPSADPPVLGALGPMYGTLVTSFIAMLIAIPVGLGIAIFLTELCPQWLRRPIGIAIELLARINILSAFRCHSPGWALWVPVSDVSSDVRAILGPLALHGLVETELRDVVSHETIRVSRTAHPPIEHREAPRSGSLTINSTFAASPQIYFDNEIVQNQRQVEYVRLTPLGRAVSTRLGDSQTIDAAEGISR